jgi:hypothetical protein
MDLLILLIDFLWSAAFPGKEREDLRTRLGCLLLVLPLVGLVAGATAGYHVDHPKVGGLMGFLAGSLPLVLTGWWVSRDQGEAGGDKPKPRRSYRLRRR